MCSCPAHLRLVDCVCECDHTGDRLTQLNDRRSELEAEVDRLRAENDQMRRNVAYAAAIVSGDAAEMLPETIAKLRAERDQLKEINDLMAEDRLRLIDERDRLIAEREADSAVFMAHRAAFVRLQSERNALVAKLGLDWGPDEFGDLSQVHVQSIEITNCPDEYCPGWKDSGICPNDFRHRY